MELKALISVLLIFLVVLLREANADYIWHKDEIPYESKASCKRGFSYYTNNENANETGIDVQSDIESLLDYSDKNICLYCVCAVHGRGVDCIPRDAWFCDYYRYIREDEAERDMYRNLLKQDRPTYFRQLSWRLRRTLDDGIYDFEQTVGLSNKTDKCIPFVSQYSDCTKENICGGCSNCICVASGDWMCTPVNQCLGEPEDKPLGEDIMDSAFSNIKDDLEDELNQESKDTPRALVPKPMEKIEDYLIDINEDENQDFDRQIVQMLGRRKRSADIKNVTDGVKFYHTVDEINEDTLRNVNVTGTLTARKFEGVINPSKLSRRTGMMNSNTGIKNNSLKIELNEPNYDHHIAENKIDTSSHDDKIVALEKQFLGNKTLKNKDKELSKLVVNELKKGTEVIGDTNGPIMSNITFTPENDTLTAMAFIAGNLLNQLWDMEKDSNEETQETANLKHEKIENLLELFKEPLNIRQENFLKNALETLSNAVDKEKPIDNISLCEKIEESKKLLDDADKNSSSKCKNKTEETPEPSSRSNDVTGEAISKINNVLGLINKFQQVKKAINNLKSGNKHSENDHTTASYTNKKSDVLSKDEKIDLDVFGKILETVSKLLLPTKKAKKMRKSINNHNVFRSTHDLVLMLKKLYNLDVDESSLTSKDKLVFDYLNLVRSHPSCLFDKLNDNSKPITNTEGGILLNLSEFLKIKSFVDLLKILEPEKQSLQIENKLKTPISTTFMTESTSGTPTTMRATPSSRLHDTKLKLKEHLKSIIEDLKELQLAKGIPAANLSIADTLPCIYKMLHSDRNSEHSILSNPALSPLDKVASIFNAIKKEWSSAPTRRSNNFPPKPKSAEVWERVVNNFRRTKSRRVMASVEPKRKTYEELKDMIEKLESTSKTYKNQVILKGVTPDKRLVLLKTIAEELKKYRDILENLSFIDLKTLSPKKRTELNEFTYNAVNNFKLNTKVMKSLNNTRPNRNLKDDVETFNVNKEYKPRERLGPLKSLRTFDGDNNKKIKRDDIINQLIKNRMMLYIRVKESKGLDLDNDINYSLAKKIVSYLELGNDILARELYKYLVSQKTKAVDDGQGYRATGSSSKDIKEPLIQFVDPQTRRHDQTEWTNHNSWLRQLSNLKKM